MSFILWFTGPSGAGKSTLAHAVAAALARRGISRLEVLDGDDIREHISKGLGFTREDRRTNVLRIGYVARLLAKHGVVAITAAISPYAEDRRAVREASSVPFIEVHASVPLEALIARDPKGLYKRALAGELPHFTGVSAPYEPPEAPEIRVLTGEETIEESTRRIIDALAGRGLVPGPATGPPPGSTPGQGCAS